MEGEPSEEDDAEPGIVAAPVIARPKAAEATPITLEQALQRIGPRVLETLEAKFNGSLVAVRAPDERDHLF